MAQNMSESNYVEYSSTVAPLNVAVVVKFVGFCLHADSEVSPKE